MRVIQLVGVMLLFLLSLEGLFAASFCERENLLIEFNKERASSFSTLFKVKLFDTIINSYEVTVSSKDNALRDFIQPISNYCKKAQSTIVLQVEEIEPTYGDNLELSYRLITQNKSVERKVLFRKSLESMEHNLSLLMISLDKSSLLLRKNKPNLISNESIIAFDELSGGRLFEDESLRLLKLKHVDVRQESFEIAKLQKENADYGLWGKIITVENLQFLEMGLTSKIGEPLLLKVVPSLCLVGDARCRLSAIPFLKEYFGIDLSDGRKFGIELALKKDLSSSDLLRGEVSFAGFTLPNDMTLVQGVLPATLEFRVKDTSHLDLTLTSLLFFVIEYDTYLKTVIGAYRDESFLNDKIELIGGDYVNVDVHPSFRVKEVIVRFNLLLLSGNRLVASSPDESLIPRWTPGFTNQVAGGGKLGSRFISLGYDYKFTRLDLPADEKKFEENRYYISTEKISLHLDPSGFINKSPGTITFEGAKENSKAWYVNLGESIVQKSSHKASRYTVKMSVKF